MNRLAIHLGCGIGWARGALLLSFLVAACGARTVADDSSAKEVATPIFPVGTYTNCARGVKNLDGNVFLNVSGFESGARLTLTQSGRTVTAEYVEHSGEASLLDFVVSTNTAATLAAAGQVAPGSSGLCVLGVGVGNQQSHAAEFSANAGALTYDSGTVFVTLQGTIRGDLGPCGSQTSPSSSWLLCQNGPPPPPVDAPAVSSKHHQLPVGNYACSSQIGTFQKGDGFNQYVASGGDGGSLMLTQSGEELAAIYSGDSHVAGSSRWRATTGTTATPDVNQHLTAPCAVLTDPGGTPSQTPGRLALTSGSLTVFESALFLSFAGVMGADSPCPGAQKAGSLLCSKQ